jgi:D-alanyl-D-alanine dipeptidase
MAFFFYFLLLRNRFILNHFPCQPNQDNGEPLIPLSEIPTKLQIYPYYYHQKIRGASSQCFLRQGAAERLAFAVQNLPEGYTLVILDAWRPYRVQLALYDMVQDLLRKQGYPEKKVQEELGKFVAAPSIDPDHPSPHMTGGAIDLTLAKNGQWVIWGRLLMSFQKRHSRAGMKGLI